MNCKKKSISDPRKEGEQKINYFRNKNSEIKLNSDKL